VDPNLGQILHLVATHDRFLMLGHAFPDGDCTGTGLALARALGQRGKTCAVAAGGPLPETLRRLPGAEAVVPLSQVPPGRFQVAVLLDCASPERTGLSEAQVRRLAPVLINLDHHVTNRGYGEGQLVDPEAASTAEVAIRVVDALGVPLDREMASLLYVSLITDTRGFRSSATRAESLRLGARLVEAGADPAALAREVLGTRTGPGLRLLSRGLARIELDPQLPVAWLALTRRDYRASGALPEEGEELVDFVSSVRDRPLAVFIRPGLGRRWRVGLRSPGRPDVSRAAALLGGGGHAGSAGIELAGSLESVRQRVRHALREVLAGEEPG
jgi:phosphoesterase RecJ-like protein